VISRVVTVKICFKRVIGFLNMSSSLQIKSVAFTFIAEGEFSVMQYKTTADKKSKG
jgi:hypothetical protein